MIEEIGHNSTTTDKELDIVGHKYFGDEWIGVFSADRYPKFLERLKNAYFILNIDDSNGSGIHWVSFFYKDNEMLFYDSFGRDKDTLSPHFEKLQVRQSNPNVEQELISKTCGQISLAWLLTCMKFGHIVGEYI